MDKQKERGKRMRFDLSKYATVAERLAQFHKDYPDGRIITEWENNYRFGDAETKSKTWVIKASVYLSAGDQANELPKATGHAFEIDGTGGANNTSALENAESSAIGRALMVMGYSMNKEPNALASREEMEKVQRGSSVVIKGKLTEEMASTALDYLAKLEELTTKEEVRELYTEAQRKAVSKEVLKKIADKGKTL